MTVPSDRFGRRLRNLRLSVTDRCNLRCDYCMPEEEYTWLPKANVLTFEETLRLVDAFVGLGVEKVRLTGGEPLLRSDLPVLVRMIAERHRLDDLAMTTNGVLLPRFAQALRDAGLQRITVSLDTLDRDTFRMLTRRDDLQRVHDGIAAARDAGFAELKIDTVVIAGVNDGELPALVEHARSLGAEVRFIEYMDVGGATRWSMQDVVPRAEMLSVLERAYGPITPLVEHTSAPAERFLLSDGTVFGIIASTTAPFCRACDRSRLTADGHWFACLYAANGVDLRTPLRAGASTRDLAGILADRWRLRDDRGAELRLAAAERVALAAPEALRSDPHLEMHTRGG
jgi:cyclic pyranopterin phosphate synthase